MNFLWPRCVTPVVNSTQKKLYQFIFIQNQFATSASKRNIAGSSTHGKNTKFSYQPRGLEAFGRFEINANDFI